MVNNIIKDGVKFQWSDFQIFMVLSFSRAPEAIMFSVGWQDEHKTTSNEGKTHKTLHIIHFVP